MKWGVRRQRSKKEQKVRDKRSKALKNVRTLSNDDIDSYTNRLSAEKKLKELLREDLTPGRAMAQKVLSNSGQRVATTVLAGAGMYATKVAIETGLGGGKKHGKPLKEVIKLKDAAAYITPKPKR